MANGAFKFKDSYGNVVSFISGSGSNISFSGGTLDLSGMTGLTLGNLTLSGTTQNALSASHAASYLLTSSFNTYSGSFAITGSNLFKGDQTISGSVIPSVTNTYDLGSPTNNFRHLYLSSASLYIDGTKVLGSTAQELQITTDVGQSFKILEAGSDNITLQSADGNIEFKTSGGGDVVIDPTNGIIGLKGTVTVYTGNKVVSSDGNSIQFGNGITVTGSIVSTVTPLVSGSSQISYTGISNVPSGLISSSAQVTGFGFATTGSNNFQGTQTITGSLYISSDLVVQGSSSLQNITASAVNIGANIINLNTSNPAIRFAGLSVFDSGSIGGSGSFLYDAVEDEFIFIHRGDNANITSSVVLMGPQTYNDVGNEIYPTANRLLKGTGNEHVGDSIITETGGDIGVSGSLSITGSIVATGTSLISGSAQVDVMSTTNIARLATTGSNIFTSNQIVSGSLVTTSNIGAGTPSPQYKLDVYTAGATSAMRINSDTTQNSQIRLEENGSLKFGITYVPADSTTRFYFAGDGSDLITLKGSSVGIGTSTPVTYGTKNLDVNAGSGGSAYIVARANSNGGTVELAFDTDSGYLSTKSNHPLRIRTNDITRLTFSTGGTATFTSNIITSGVLTSTSAIINNGTNSTDGIKIIGSTLSSAFTSGIEFMRTPDVTGGSKIEPLRDIAIGGVGLNFLVTTNNTAEINATYTSAITVLNSGRIGINTTNPLAGFQIEKYGSKFDSDSQYNQPAGNVFLSVTGAVADQVNWFGMRGTYNSSTGSTNLLLQANYRDVGSQAGHYVSSKAQSFGVADFIIGKLVTSTSVSTPPTLVPQLTIVSSGAATFSDRIQITSNGGTNPVLAIRQTNAATQGYDFETEDVSVGRLDLYGVTSTGRVQMMSWIKANGRVGIGAIAPRTKLQVTPVSNAEIPVLGTATGVATFTSANTNYGLQFNSTSDGSFHIQSQRFDNIATAYSLILNYAGGNVGIGEKTAPGCSLDVSSRTDAVALPRGTTAQRPGSSIAGMGRFNTEISKTEFYNGTVWVAIGGAGDGSTSSSAASSAKAIKAAVGNPTSGVYWLQIPNVNGGNAFQCYCDFTMDGGIGYAIIFNQYFQGAETGPSHASFGSSTITSAGFDTEYQISPTAMISNYGVTKLAVFARTGGSSGGGITGASYFNWVAFSGPTTTQYNLIFTNGYGSTQFTGTFNSSDGNTGTAYFPNSHGNSGGVTQITNGTTVNNYILYEYKQGDGTDPNHFWMVANGRDGDTYWVNNNRYGSGSGNVMYNRWGGVALY